MKAATTKQELATLLPQKPWYSKLAKGDVELLMSTIEYNEGHLAHMKYGDIRKQLTEEEFDEFLGVVGISKEKFEEFDGHFCTGDIAAKYCAQGAGVCDPSWCHGN
jgi:hypothetical protein